MSLQAVVRKDFTDSIRSFTLASTTLLFVCFAAFLAAIQWVPDLYGSSTATTSTLALLNSMRQPTVFMIPLIGLLIAYDTLAGEREDGSLRLLLGLPNARHNAVLGKFIGRTGVIAVAIGVAYAVAGAIALATYESFDVRVFALYTVLTVGYGAVYVALATGFSAAMDSRLRALSGAGGLYALFILGWDVLLLALQLAIYGNEIPEAGLPDWFKFIGLVNPSTAFMHAVRTVIPEYEALTFYPQGSAWYLGDWMGFVVLAAWAVVPLALGLWRFERADIH
ncbi:ABC transporter permease subunit [Halobaculum roseum]|uniref:ABC transporter permease subunit n=1 Tax=Halobaculum roseum TaxID=2175149 RepID=A0ABD5MQ45_9EURY|nr:ABC transporter permease subunit [Halobaculum roseum]QZY01267.1 ABC transporter permease [Halobaculum roseum]